MRELNPTNRYSLWFGVGAMVAVGLGVAALWRRVAGLSIALASVLGGVLMWQKLRFGASTVPTVWQLRQAISSGRPVLVEVFSDT